VPAPHPITPEEFLTAPGVEGWSVAGPHGPAERTFGTGTFARGVELVQEIAALAEAADHHPDVDLRYRTVTVRLVTQDVGALSERDAALAAAISAAADAPAPATLAERRLAVVRRHMEAENDLDFETVMATFAHPRYELMATGRVFDGDEEVRRYFASSRRRVPDQRNTDAVLRTAGDDGVLAEFDLLGTHADSGRTFRTRMAALFLFEPRGDGIVCERVYFDSASVTG
jgi:pterin-4a-carbinolamine dehydratase/ketosteroid isomerase-like protein